ncbi:hypothetical protein C8F01DRAFT_1244190 [Mycena amicta]|nr:hypothetical protein C8F01DRAFT_1244190 [Mycena amicta]
MPPMPSPAPVPAPGPPAALRPQPCTPARLPRPLPVPPLSPSNPALDPRAAKPPLYQWPSSTTTHIDVKSDERTGTLTDAMDGRKGLGTNGS